MSARPFTGTRWTIRRTLATELICNRTRIASYRESSTLEPVSKGTSKMIWMGRWVMFTIALSSLAFSPASAGEQCADAYNESNWSLALERCEAAAEQGDAEAQHYLGSMYVAGDGVEENYAEAVRWFQLGAEQDHLWSIASLGMMYQFGFGVEVDYSEAMRLFRLAAKRGDQVAQMSMGQMYEEGNGVLQDYLVAHMWYNISSANGNGVGQYYRDQLANKLTDGQVREAQAMAKRCMESDYEDC